MGLNPVGCLITSKEEHTACKHALQVNRCENRPWDLFLHISFHLHDTCQSVYTPAGTLFVFFNAFILFIYCNSSPILGFYHIYLVYYFSLVSFLLWLNVVVIWIGGYTSKVLLFNIVVCLFTCLNILTWYQRWLLFPTSFSIFLLIFFCVATYLIGISLFFRLTSYIVAIKSSL